MTTEQTEATPQEDQETQKAAERIAAEARDVKQRISDLVVDLYKTGTQPIGRLPELAGNIFDGAKTGVQNVAEDKQADVLANVVDGLADGFTRGANALKLSIEEAHGKGKSFAEDEIKTAAEDFRALESMFVDRATQLIKSTFDMSKSQAKDLLDHTRRAAAGMRPEIQSALDAAKSHPVSLAKETVSVAGGVTRLAAGSLLQALGKAVTTTGNIVRGDSPDEKDEAPSS